MIISMGPQTLCRHASRDQHKWTKTNLLGTCPMGTICEVQFLQVFCLFFGWDLQNVIFTFWWLRICSVPSCQVCRHRAGRCRIPQETREACPGQSVRWSSSSCEANCAIKKSIRKTFFYCRLPTKTQRKAVFRPALKRKLQVSQLDGILLHVVNMSCGKRANHSPIWPCSLPRSLSRGQWD